MPERTAPWAEPVHQRLRAWRARQPLVDTCRAQLYFPNERQPRWAVPAGDLLLPAPGALTYEGLAVLSPGDADTLTGLLTPFAQLHRWLVDHVAT